MNGKDDTKNWSIYLKKKWGGNHYVEALFLDFFKWNDSEKTDFKICLKQSLPRK